MVCNFDRRSGAVTTLVCAWLMLSASPSAVADKFDLYMIRPERQTLFPDVSMPERQQGPTLFGAIFDGRIVAITTVDGNSEPQGGSPATPTVHIQTSVGGPFAEVGPLPLDGHDWPDFGGSFMAVSPSGDRIAVGNNDDGVAVFPATSLAPSSGVPAPIWFDVGNNVGAWHDEQVLAISNFGASGGEVVILDTNTAAVDTVVTGIGASAGVAFDAAGHLYTGEGFSSGGKPTGQVRRFERARWQEAIALDTPLSFQSDLDGMDVVQYTSAASLAFDDEGNLIMGGGRFDRPPAESDGFGIYRPADGALRELDPNGLVGNFYNIAYNGVTGEIYANEPFSLTSAQSIEPRILYVASVPEPTALALTAVAGIVLLVYALMLRFKQRGATSHLHKFRLPRRQARTSLASQHASPSFPQSQIHVVAAQP